jgi:hypothetical protein
MNIAQVGIHTKGTSLWRPFSLFSLWNGQSSLFAVTGPLFKFCNSLAACCLILSNVRRNNNPPLYLDPARHQQWLRCFLTATCAEEICEFKPRSQHLPEREKISSPRRTSSLFNCLRYKNYKMRLCSSEAAMKEDCSLWHFLCFACALNSFFPPLTSVASIFGVHIFLCGGCRQRVWSASDDCCRCCASESILHTQQPGRKTNFTSHPDRNIEPFWLCLLNCRSCYGAQSWVHCKLHSVLRRTNGLQLTCPTMLLLYNLMHCSSPNRSSSPA